MGGSMYYPYLRGKQFELVMLREMGSVIAEHKFVPIIEPVKSNLSPLQRAVDVLMEQSCNFILIMNPHVGELKLNPKSIFNNVIDKQLSEYKNYSVGIHLSASDDLVEIGEMLDKVKAPISLIHNGFREANDLVELIKVKKPEIVNHIFAENRDSTLYRRHFKGTNRVIVQDGFISRSNKDYPDTETFSELYLTYSDLGCNGFGDFLTVGCDFKEGGGPAYAVAIHITYVDTSADNQIAIKHYKSNDVDSSSNPGGKFLQALEKLVADVNAKGSLILKTKAIQEYLNYYDSKHFPGLGFVKKLSMQHHVELMAHLFPPEL